jgi:uncharacterized protein YjbI with pentapeptide repeats
MVFQRQIGGANEHDDLIEKIQEGIALTDQEKTQLSGIVLDGISFADGYDLSGADFSEATFIGINDLGEPRVNFENAIFTRATFRDDCYFPNAVFNGASFAEAKLKEVEFRHASFGGHVDFTRTRLYDVVFDCSPDSEIGTIDFTESRWKNVTICPSYPSNTPRETRRAFFNRSVFTNVNMTNTIILGAFEVDMQYILSRFTATQRSQISFHVVVDEVPQDEENTEAGYLNTDVPGNVPGNVPTTSTTLVDKIRSNVPLTDQEKSQLSGIVLENYQFDATYDLNHANLTGARFLDVRFDNVYMDHANLTGATLYDVELASASCSHADFTRATLREVSFTDETMSHPADFTESTWSNVVIFMSGVTRLSDLDVDMPRYAIFKSNFTNTRFEHMVIDGAHIHEILYIQGMFTPEQLAGIAYVNRRTLEGHNETENDDVEDEDEDASVDVPPSGLGRSEVTIPYRARGTDPVGLEYDIPVREFLEDQDHADHVAIQLHRDIFILDTSDVRRLYRDGTRYECYEVNTMRTENINRRPTETLFNLKATGVPLDGYVYLSEIKAVVETRPSRYYTLVATHKEVVSVVSADVIDHAGSFVGASHCQDGQGGRVYRIMVATLGQPSPKPRKTRLKLPLRSSQSRKPKTLKKLKKLIKTTKTTLKRGKRGKPKKKKRTLRNYYRSHSHSHT